VGVASNADISLYNVFYYTDPIAYQLNAAVDAMIAAQRSPLAITSVTAPFYATVTEGFSTITKYLPTYLGGVATEKKPVRPGAIRLPSGIEVNRELWPTLTSDVRAERRGTARGESRRAAFLGPQPARQCRLLPPIGRCQRIPRWVNRAQPT
jgi:hypothetical protein